MFIKEAFFHSDILKEEYLESVIIRRNQDVTTIWQNNYEQFAVEGAARTLQASAPGTTRKVGEPPVRFVKDNFIITERSDGLVLPICHMAEYSEIEIFKRPFKTIQYKSRSIWWCQSITACI